MPPPVANHPPQLVEMVALRSMKAMTLVAVQVPQFVATAAARVTIAVADVISGPQSLVIVAGQFVKTVPVAVAAHVPQFDVIVAGQLANEGWVLAAEAVDQSDVLRALAVAAQVPQTVVTVALRWIG
jgi:hypothetical protein